MKVKKVIAVFLFLVLSVQVLPLKQIAAWLTSGQVTEEIAHVAKPVKSNQLAEEIHHPYLLGSSFSFGHSLMISLQSRIHRDETLILRHTDDILTPPPNC
jgi:hypothetical protein